MKRFVKSTWIWMCLLPGLLWAGTPVVVDRAFSEQQIRALQQQLARLEQAIQDRPELDQQLGPLIRGARGSAEALNRHISMAPSADPGQFVMNQSAQVIELMGRLVQDGLQYAQQQEGTVVSGAPRSSAHAGFPTAMTPLGTESGALLGGAAPGSASSAAVLATSGLPAPVAVGPAQFRSIVVAIQAETFESDKLTVVAQVATDSHFTVSQVKSLVDLFSFRDDKLKVVELLAGRIVDRENSHLLLSAFTFSSDKERVQALMSR